MTIQLEWHNLSAYYWINDKNMEHQADYILYNGNVITMDPSHPYEYFVAVSGNKIIGTGSKTTLEQYKRAGTKLIDCAGGTILPGFNDAHCHPLSYAAGLLQINCSSDSVDSITDIQKLIQKEAAVLPNGKWIKASGYDEYDLTEKRHLTKHDLDIAAPDNPVILVHKYGQDCVLNSLALKLTGIIKETQETPGTVIFKDKATGEPNGHIAGNNEDVSRAVPPASENEQLECIKKANFKYLSSGITSLQDTGWTNKTEHWNMYKSLKNQDILSPRISMLIGSDFIQEFSSSRLSTGSGDNSLRIGGVKIALDESTGCQHPPQEDINKTALEAADAGFQISLHVHDIHMLRGAFKTIELVKTCLPDYKYRYRIEHCAVCPAGLLQELKNSGAIIIAQPSYLYYFGDRYKGNISEEQEKWLFPYKSFEDYQITTAFSSDSPMVAIDPLKGLYSAITRKTREGYLLVSDEKIPILSAVNKYTFQGAYASMEENIKGSLTRGKLADIVVLNGDLLNTDPDNIDSIKIRYTIIGGKIVWENSRA